MSKKNNISGSGHEKQSIVYFKMSNLQFCKLSLFSNWQSRSSSLSLGKPSTEVSQSYHCYLKQNL